MQIHNIKEREQYTIWRRRNRVRICDVAKYCQCSISYISMWENGIININDEILSKYNHFIISHEERKVNAK